MIDNRQIYEQNICLTVILGPLVKVRRTSYWNNLLWKIWVWTLPSIFHGFSIQNFQRFLLSSNCPNSVNIWARKMFFFCQIVQNFARNRLVMLSLSYAGKNAYSAGKTSGVLRGVASGANRCYVLAHCTPPPCLWGKRKWSTRPELNSVWYGSSDTYQMASLESFKGLRHPLNQDPGWEGSPTQKLKKISVF